MLFTKGKMQGCDFEPISKDRMTLQSDWASMHQNEGLHCGCDKTTCRTTGKQT